MMRTALISFLIMLIFGLGTACRGQPNGESRTFAISTATPGILPVAAAVPSDAPLTIEDFIISDTPRCPGFADLKAPVKFDWPDIDNILQKLEQYHWGYYTCAMTQPELLAFLRAGMPKPPYLWREVNHVDYAGATVVLFYQGGKGIWNYVWTLPGPDKQTSYLLIAKGEPGFPQTWECRLMFPQMPGQDSPMIPDKSGFASGFAPTLVAKGPV